MNLIPVPLLLFGPSILPGSCTGPSTKSGPGNAGSRMMHKPTSCPQWARLSFMIIYARGEREVTTYRSLHPKVPYDAQLIELQEFEYMHVGCLLDTSSAITFLSQVTADKANVVAPYRAVGRPSLHCYHLNSASWTLLSRLVLSSSRHLKGIPSLTASLCSWTC